MKRSPLRRRVALPRASKFNNSRCSFKGERFDSRLECAAYEMLTRQQAAGEIRNLRRQVRHELYLTDVPVIRDQFGRELPITSPVAVIAGWCSCRAPGQPAPDGFDKFRGVRLDFEYETPEGQPVSADAKGFVQRDGGQYYAYIIFALIHGREIRLIKKGDIR